MTDTVIIRKLGLVDFPRCFRAMSEYTGSRDATSDDEIWLLQHPPVYTLGLAGKMEFIHERGTIPLYQTDRGGQVTYHGPGQLVVYLMLDLKRRKLGIRDFVSLLEQSVIDYLTEQSIHAERRPGAPGVYVEDKKIAALGIRVRRSCSYHGLALNVDMDTHPFKQIDPCGYRDLDVTQMVEHRSDVQFEMVRDQYLDCLLRQLGENCQEIRVKHTIDDLLSATEAA